jgi:hypothetical protein
MLCEEFTGWTPDVGGNPVLDRVGGKFRSGSARKSCHLRLP